MMQIIKQVEDIKIEEQKCWNVRVSVTTTIFYHPEISEILRSARYTTLSETIFPSQNQTEALALGSFYKFVSHFA